MKDCNDPEQWFHFYQQMYKMRAFEDQAKHLYLRDQIPGLTHM